MDSVNSGFYYILIIIWWVLGDKKYKFEINFIFYI